MANTAVAGYGNGPEAYGYDAQLDRLTGANYGDGNPGQSQSWSYDAAGNRSDSVVDALNRATSVGGVPCTSDVLGNRTSTGSRGLGWDCLSRLAFVTDPSPTAGYALVGQYGYRADGMRTLKYTPNALSVYRYDGQMGIEDEEWSTDHFVTRYGLGARGVDMIERTGSSGTVTAFPLYDAHGNTVATLSRDGAGGYSLADRRSYDAWGVVRSQQSGGDPKLRYCGSLGHKADDETGLVYMRARYYELGSGRFVSEDPAAKGWNWFGYCNDNPVRSVDPSGCMSISETIGAMGAGDALDAGDGGGAVAFENWFVESLGRYTCSENVQVAIELVDEDAFEAELGGGTINGSSASRQLTDILVQLKPSGMNPATFCHELGEAMVRTIQANFGDSFAEGHKLAQAVMEDAWQYFMGGG